jgi:hypothetical protein
MVRSFPSVARKIVRQGHTLAHHTHDHDRLPSYSLDKASELIDRGISDVQKIAYGNPSSTPRIPFFRYPYLDRTRQTDRLLAQKGMIAFGANIDALDWKPDSPQTVHDRIMRQLRKQGRGIILMHDIQWRTAKMLPDLLRSLKDEGYAVVHMVAEEKPKPVPDEMVVASLDLPRSKAISVKLSKTILDGRVERTDFAKPAASSTRLASVQAPQPTVLKKLDEKPAGKKSVRVAVAIANKPSPLTKARLSVRRRSAQPVHARYRRARRKPTLLLLAGVKPRGTIHVGSWAVRRSQWILR